jgi:hypothetical protein
MKFNCLILILMLNGVGFIHSQSIQNNFSVSCDIQSLKLLNLKNDINHQLKIGEDSILVSKINRFGRSLVTQLGRTSLEAIDTARLYFVFQVTLDEYNISGNIVQKSTFLYVKGYNSELNEAVDSFIVKYIFSFNLKKQLVKDAKTKDHELDEDYTKEANHMIKKGVAEIKRRIQVESNINYISDQIRKITCDKITNDKSVNAIYSDFFPNSNEGDLSIRIFDYSSLKKLDTYHLNKNQSIALEQIIGFKTLELINKGGF